MLRRYAAEFLGTFVIVFSPVALASSGKMYGGDSSLMAAALVSGLSVLAMIFAFGPISAAHFNPAVTLGFAVAKRFPWRFVAPYWGAQFSGAIVAAVLSYALLGKASGAHIPSGSISVVRCVGIEAALGFILMLVIIALATDRRSSGSAPAIGIGLTVVFCVLIGGPVTGGSMNPARSFGPALFVPDALSSYWIYLLGPCIGAVCAALAFEAVRLEPANAKGAPNELLEGLH